MASFAGCNIVQPLDDDGNIKIKITINNVEINPSTGDLGFDAACEAYGYEYVNDVETLTTTFKGTAEGLLIECEIVEDGGGGGGDGDGDA